MFIRAPISYLVKLFAVLVAIVASIKPCVAADPLPTLGIEINQTSVSGLSSGAYMAGQFQLAHSKIIVGAGIVAGGPYGCAQSWQARYFPFWPGVSNYNLAQALNGCMDTQLAFSDIPNPATLLSRAERLSQNGEIDPLSNLLDDRIYLFTGGRDQTVQSPIVHAVKVFYTLAGVQNTQIRLIRRENAGHGFVTEETALDCDLTEKPYVIDCDYDQAGDILRTIYGELSPRSNTLSGRFVAFRQTDFFSTGSQNGLADSGTLYIPNECENGSGCRVHIVFHGCRQSQEEVGDAFIKGSGFAAWADTNRIVLLFPQIKKSISNPRGCWDWWGYTTLGFHTKSAPQITAVRHMLDRLAETAPR